jgi:Ni/Co efflux regulator RcnB
MKRHLLLLSAAAVVGLASPMAALADPPSRGDNGGQGQSDRGASHADKSQPGGEQGHAGGGQGQSHGGQAQSHGALARQESAQGGQGPSPRPATQRASGGQPQRSQPSGGQVRASQYGAGVTTRQTTTTRTARTATTRQASRSPQIASLRGNVSASRHFQASPYQRPQGYVARRWTYGGRLPRTYFARNYWITDFLLYSLIAPPEGLVWVRVGDDALLIDEYTGEVIRVEYGVFY